MFDMLKGFFSKEHQFSQLAQVISHVGDLLSMVESNYMKDKDSRNAAIDTICQILQQHKDATPQG